MKDVDGILIIDKPAGMTSHDVVSRVRRILKTRRVGHTGTLDPFATGVLVMMVGKATRLARFLDKDTKEYEADVQFGYETDTGDVTGMRKSDGGDSVEDVAAKLDEVDWEATLEHFKGEIIQTPPMFSAKKIEGKRLYELARRGEEVERRPVPVQIHELRILPDQPDTPLSTRRIGVVCSAGTYIRTLAEDIGKHIGIGAHLVDLRRTAAGKFDISQSISLDALDSLSDPAAKLLPLDLAVAHLSEFLLAEDRITKTKGGLSTRVDVTHLKDGEYVRMTGNGVGLVAIGVYDGQERSLQPKVVLI
jgi:tRNA pseudouridine55 synthase